MAQKKVVKNFSFPLISKVQTPSTPYTLNIQGVFLEPNM